MDAWFKQYKTLTALFPEKTYSSLEEGQPAALLVAVQKHDGQIVSEQAILTTTFEGSDEELRVYRGTSKKEQISSWLADKRKQDIDSCLRKATQLFLNFSEQPTQIACTLIVQKDDRKFVVLGQNDTFTKQIEDVKNEILYPNQYMRRKRPQNLPPEYCD